MPKVPPAQYPLKSDHHGFTFAAGGCPTLENYRELKTQKVRNHKYVSGYTPFFSRSLPLRLTITNRNWPKWYLQSYLLGVPTMIVGNRSKRNLLTSVQTMSMERALATSLVNSPDFDPSLALGRIHNILSALIQHCKTRAGYLYTGCFTCELQIRSGGTACVPPVAVSREAKAELVKVWELVRQTDAPGEAPISPYRRIPIPSRTANEERRTLRRLGPVPTAGIPHASSIANDYRPLRPVLRA